MFFVNSNIHFCYSILHFSYIFGFRSFTFDKPTNARKVSKYGVFSGPYFCAFGLNTERYSVSLRIQSKCGKMWTRKNSVFRHFSRVNSPRLPWNIFLPKDRQTAKRNREIIALWRISHITQNETFL